MIIDSMYLLYLHYYLSYTLSIYHTYLEVQYCHNYWTYASRTPQPTTMTATMHHSVETIPEPTRSSDAALPIQFIPGHVLGRLQKMTVSTARRVCQQGRRRAGWSRWWLRSLFGLQLDFAMAADGQSSSSFGAQFPTHTGIYPPA